MISRRTLLAAGGGIAALLPAVARGLAATGTRDIVMKGGANGAHVWFDPAGIFVLPGQTLRWTNRDNGNSHTATAYHPQYDGRPLRIPEGAAPWDSGFLLPGESFSVTLTVPGVYDYFCLPHEHAGMVGRIVVGKPDREVAEGEAGAIAGIPTATFPTVDEIMAKHAVRRQ